MACSMLFNIFNHKTENLRLTEASSQKLVISERNALIHSESLALDTQHFHFTAVPSKVFCAMVVVYFYTPGEKVVV